jgi:hypothetical protein
MDSRHTPEGRPGRDLARFVHHDDHYEACYSLSRSCSVRTTMTLPLVGAAVVAVGAVVLGLMRGRPEVLGPTPRAPEPAVPADVTSLLERLRKHGL